MQGLESVAQWYSTRLICRSPGLDPKQALPKKKKKGNKSEMQNTDRN